MTCTPSANMYRTESTCNVGNVLVSSWQVAAMRHLRLKFEKPHQCGRPTANSWAAVNTLPHVYIRRAIERTHHTPQSHRAQQGTRSKVITDVRRQKTIKLHHEPTVRPDDHHLEKWKTGSAVTNNVEVVGVLPLTTSLFSCAEFNLRTEYSMELWSVKRFEKVPSRQETDNGDFVHHRMKLICGKTPSWQKDRQG